MNLFENHFLSTEHLEFKKKCVKYLLENDTTQDNIKTTILNLKKKDVCLPYSSAFDANIIWKELMVLDAFSQWPNGILGMSAATSYFVEKFILYQYAPHFFSENTIAKNSIFSLALTEPGAGSDLRNISTQAVENHEGYIINGEKTYITNATFADYYCVFCTTSQSNSLYNYTLFLVDANAPGIEVESLSTLGHDGALGKIRFNDTQISKERVVGSVGSGLIILLGLLKYERLIIAYRAIAHSWKIYQDIIHYAKNREVLGGLLYNQELFQVRLVELWSQLSSASIFVCDSINQIFNEQSRLINFDTQSAQCKLLATQALNDIADYYMQVMGAQGYLSPSSAAQAFVDAPALKLAGGSDEILLEIIASDL